MLRWVWLPGPIQVALVRFQASHPWAQGSDRTALRERDRIVAGQRFDLERIEAGQYLLKRQPMQDNDGLVDWLLSCPEKDWFQSVPSESTADL